MRQLLAQFGEQREPIKPGHNDVADDRRRLNFSRQPQGFDAIGGLVRLPTPGRDNLAQTLSSGLLVVHNQNFKLAH
jgi:hypothetical protein